MPYDFLDLIMSELYRFRLSTVVLVNEEERAESHGMLRIEALRKVTLFCHVALIGGLGLREDFNSNGSIYL